MGIDRLTFLRAYLGTRRAQVHLTSRDRILRRQDRLWRSFAGVVAQTPALSHLARARLADFPVSTPEVVRGAFARWNTLGLIAERAHRAAADAERGGSGEVLPGVSAGFSTGTSGLRGLFLSSSIERARYLGQAIAKLLPWNALLRPWRIALCLRADNALYRDVTSAGPFDFRFLHSGMAACDLQQHVGTFDPHILIAPSHVLADLARSARRISSLSLLFYGAEPMGDDERLWIRERLGVRPDPIYQATEGFLGAACHHGTLHLNEDTLIIEHEPVAGLGRFRPIVTDLQRTSQPIVRMLLDDILEPATDACPCGSALLAVRGIEGRVSDVWRWNGVAIPPREVERTLARGVGPDVDWRASASPGEVTIEIADACAQRARNALGSLLAQRQLAVSVKTGPMTPMMGTKRRRVVWRDA